MKQWIKNILNKRVKMKHDETEQEKNEGTYLVRKMVQLMTSSRCEKKGLSIEKCKSLYNNNQFRQ